MASTALAAIHKAKADAAVSMGREVLELQLAASGETAARLVPVLPDVLAAARCRNHALTPADLGEGEVVVRRAHFAA